MIIKNNNYLFRLLEEKDLSYMVKWRNDPVVNKFTASFKPITLEEEINWFKNIQNNPSIEVYLNWDYTKNQPIGYAILKNINQLTNELEVGCYICEHKYLNRGVSFIVAASFLDYLFLKRNFEKAFMYIHEKHEIGIRAGVFMGAVFEGFLDKSIFKDAKTGIYSFYKDKYLARKEEFKLNISFYNKLYNDLKFID